MSEGKCARVGSLLRERTEAAPYAANGTQRCFRYRSVITVATPNADAVCPDGKPPPLTRLPLYLNQVAQITVGRMSLGFRRPAAYG